MSGGIDSMRYVHCQTMRNVAASMTLDHLFSNLGFASSEPLGGNASRTRFTGIATLEPQLLPLFNTDTVERHPFGGDTTRLRKTAEVLADAQLRWLLLVCMRGFRRDRAALNCGRCYKCARVLLHAEAIGSLDAVADTFDMAAYHRGRPSAARSAAQPQRLTAAQAAADLAANSAQARPSTARYSAFE
ncbi:MAG: hypothetical protein ACKOOF_13120 [Planctomycetaceae bacterium]